jgi:endonuclease III related protein
MNIRVRKNLEKIYHKLYKYYGPQRWWPARSRFEMMVGAILAQNTAWSNVERAISNLKSERLLSPEAMARLGKKRLAKLIRPAGYYNIKAERLKNFISFLSSEYGLALHKMRGEPTPVLKKALLGVNGVGPETCDSILLYAFDRPVFVVDAYTKRVLSRHGILKPGSSYEDFQKVFTDNLPHDSAMFNEYHALIVRLAKDFCKARPRCRACPLELDPFHPRCVNKLHTGGGKNCLANNIR